MSGINTDRLIPARDTDGEWLDESEIGPAQALAEEIQSSEGGASMTYLDALIAKRRPWTGNQTEYVHATESDGRSWAIAKFRGRAAVKDAAQALLWYNAGPELVDVLQVCVLELEKHGCNHVDSAVAAKRLLRALEERAKQALGGE